MDKAPAYTAAHCNCDRLRWTNASERNKIIIFMHLLCIHQRVEHIKAN